MPLPPPPPSKPRPRVHLHVAVPRGGDSESVIKRLGQIYDLLQEYKGQDQFSLYVDNGGMGKKVLLSFPNYSTRHCMELEQKLRGMVGAGSLRIEDLSEAPDGLYFHT